MSEDSEKFGAELSELMAVGRVELPHLAELFAELTRGVARTSGSDATAFPTSAGSYPPVPSGVGQAWTALRAQLQGDLGYLADATEQSGEAIVHIVDAYAEANTSAEREMERLWNVHLDGPTGHGGAQDPWAHAHNPYGGPLPTSHPDLAHPPSGDDPADQPLPTPPDPGAY